jgi:hypothetical protein
MPAATGRLPPIPTLPVVARSDSETAGVREC